MTRDERFFLTLWGAIAIAVVFFLSGLKVARAQQLPHKTQGWDISTEPSVYVIDTTGVCLYVRINAVAAVSKASLPAGAGCE